MTIKKPMKTKPAAASAEATVATDASAAAGATIADRFRLDMPDPNANKRKVGASDAVALVAALAGLAVAGFLAFTLWKHWEFLMPA